MATEGKSAAGASELHDVRHTSQKLEDLIQSSADSSEAKAACLVTDLVTGGTLAAELGLSHPPESPSEDDEM